MSEESRRLLAILAHPDDETFIIGGTLARYAADGADIHLLIAMTGGDNARRAAELERATRVLGISTVRFLGGVADREPDAQTVAALADPIADALRDLRPDVVITFDATGGTGHPDHITVGHATLLAFERVAAEPGARPMRLYAAVFGRRLLRLALFLRRILRRGSNPSTDAGNTSVDLDQELAHATQEQIPSTFIDVRAHLEQRRRAVRCYETALTEGPWWMRRWELLPARLRGVAAPREVFARLHPPFKPGEAPETDFFSTSADR